MAKHEEFKQPLECTRRIGSIEVVTCPNLSKRFQTCLQMHVGSVHQCFRRDGLLLGIHLSRRLHVHSISTLHSSVFDNTCRFEDFQVHTRRLYSLVCLVDEVSSQRDGQDVFGCSWFNSPLAVIIPRYYLIFRYRRKHPALGVHEAVAGNIPIPIMSGPNAAA